MKLMFLYMGVYMQAVLDYSFIWIMFLYIYGRVSEYDYMCMFKFAFVVCKSVRGLGFVFCVYS